MMIRMSMDLAERELVVVAVTPNDAENAFQQTCIFNHCIPASNTVLTEPTLLHGPSLPTKWNCRLKED